MVYSRLADVKPALVSVYGLRPEQEAMKESSDLGDQLMKLADRVLQDIPVTFLMLLIISVIGYSV